MKHSVPHDLSFDLAKKAAEQALESYRARFADYSPSITWENERRAEFAFEVKGMSLKGAFDLFDDRIDIDMDVPILLRPFRKKAVDVIESEIIKWFDKARRGEV